MHAASGLVCKYRPQMGQPQLLMQCQSDSLPGGIPPCSMHTAARLGPTRPLGKRTDLDRPRPRLRLRLLLAGLPLPPGEGESTRPLLGGLIDRGLRARM